MKKTVLITVLAANLVACGGGGENTVLNGNATVNGNSGGINTSQVDTDKDGIPDAQDADPKDANVAGKIFVTHDKSPEKYTFSYNAAGKLIQFQLEGSGTDSDGVYKYQYNGQGFKSTQTFDKGNNGSIDNTTIYKTDNLGNIIEATRISSSSTNTIVDKIEYQYNSSNKITKAEFDYDNNGNNVVIDTTFELTYDSNGNLESNLKTRIGAPITYRKVTFKYDGNGNKISEEDDSENDGTIEYLTNYEYDATGKLVKAIEDDKSLLNNDDVLTFTYKGTNPKKPVFEFEFEFEF